MAPVQGMGTSGKDKGNLLKNLLLLVQSMALFFKCLALAVNFCSS